MPDVKISAGADPVTLVSTDKVPMARSASTTAYAATMAELASFANTAYVPNYYAGTPSMDATGAPGIAAFVSRGDHVHPSDTTKYAASNPSGYQTAAQVATAVAPAFNGTGRNLLHNPLFNVAQRGAGPWTTSGYTLDRWFATTTLDTISFAQAPHSDGSRAMVGDESATFFMSNAFTGNAGTSAYNNLSQRIEDVRRLAGKTVTVSFWANSGGTLKLGINMLQWFGTGGSPSAALRILVTGNSITTTTTMTRYSTTMIVPSIAGKTLGTNNDHSTWIEFWYSSGATNNAIAGNVGVQSGQMNLWGVQLEVGSVATPLEKPDPRYDLANCQRFYQTGTSYLAGTAVASPAPFGSWVVFPVTMRAAPSVIYIGSPATTNVTGLATAQITTSGFICYGSSTTTPAAAGAINLGFTASADL